MCVLSGACVCVLKCECVCVIVCVCVCVIVCVCVCDACTHTGALQPRNPRRTRGSQTPHLAMRMRWVGVSSAVVVMSLSASSASLPRCTRPTTWVGEACVRV